ncbi:MAG: hypothetical protein ABDI07_11265, partial [Candidatus Kryptonium sp.]
MIVSLSEIKEYLKIDATDTIYDNFLNRWNKIIQSYIEDYCQQRFEIVNITNELADGTGRLYLAVKNLPIVQINSVHFTVDNLTWQIWEDSLITDGILIYGRKIFPKGKSNFKVSYTAGWAEPPEGIKRVIIEKVAEVFAEGPGQGRLGIDSVSSGLTGTSTSTRYKELSQRHKEIL